MFLPPRKLMASSSWSGDVISFGSALFTSSKVRKPFFFPSSARRSRITAGFSPEPFFEAPFESALATFGAAVFATGAAFLGAAFSFADSFTADLAGVADFF